ncbi:MAG TPA: M48 family metallopeptidase [Gemmatimonadales bacterium]|nr:M48 family metallopeptidase [Gemmatimonadales bacterium]
MQADSPPAQTVDTVAIAEVAVPEPSALAVRYHRSGNVLWTVATALDLLLPAALLFTGLSARVRRAAARLARSRRFATIALYAVAYVLIQALVFLPLSWYAGFVRQHAYGLSTETAAAWLGDWAKAVAISVLFAALLLWVPYWLLRASPRRWWLWTGLLTAPLTVLSMIVVPVYVAPLFDDYGPMRDPALERRIARLAARAGIPDSRIYEVNKSEETRQVNAYVTGFARTKRIVLWDTLVDRLQPGELEFVVGHEIGHFVLRHTLTAIVAATLLVTLSLWVVHRVAGWLIARFRERFGFDRLEDVASLPLLALVGGVVMLAATPAGLALSRWQEREADRFGLEITRDNRAAARALVRLQEDNLAVPRTGLLYRLWRGSHPDLAERIEFGNRYSPWLQGRPSRYGDRFHAVEPAPEP